MKIILFSIISFFIGICLTRSFIFMIRSLRKKTGPICVIKIETFPLDNGPGEKVKVSYNTVDPCPTIDDAISHVENALDYLESKRDEYE